MKIDIEKFKEMQKYLHELNAMDRKDIEIEGVKIPEDYVEWWRYIGLNNCSYINTLINVGAARHFTAADSRYRP